VNEFCRHLSKDGHEIIGNHLLANGEYVVTLKGTLYEANGDPHVDYAEYKDGHTVIYVKEWTHPLYYTAGLRLLDGLLSVAFVVLVISGFRLTEYS
jgi:hypothetical protein